MVGSISRLIIFSVVDLPQPDGPDERDQLAARDVEVELLDGDRAAGVGLADALQPDHQIFGASMPGSLTRRGDSRARRMPFRQAGTARCCCRRVRVRWLP